jgi:DNA-binding NarL/FixJ family response regulator
MRDRANGDAVSARTPLERSISAPVGLASEPKPIRLLVADDDGLTRAGIRVALEGSQFTIVGEAETGPKVVPAVGRTKAEIVLLDAEIAGFDGLRCLERLATCYPGVAVVMLATEATPAQLQAAFAAGARGWVIKTIEPEDLGPAIAHALTATVLLPYGPEVDEHAAARIVGLSNRELDSLRLVGLGYSNKEIAAELWITVQTVKFHLSNVYRKLGLPNRTAAARWAHESGLLRTPTPPTTFARARHDERRDADQALALQPALVQAHMAARATRRPSPRDRGSSILVNPGECC